MEEIWKISTLAVGYEVSSNGNVRNITKKKNLKFRDNGNGYKIIGIKLQNKGKNFYVHRLVATEFLDNKNNYNQVNHIDGDKSNNNIKNLEWCNSSHNLKHAYKIGLKSNSEKQKEAARQNIKNMSKEAKLKSLINRQNTLSQKTRIERQRWAITFCKPIKCIELNKIFLSAIRASEKLNIGAYGIYNCLKKKSKTSGGYHWEYVKSKY